MMKHGGRAGTATVVVSVKWVPRPHGPLWRCGFIVSKAVGNAVTRHRTSRRLRHIVFQLMRDDVIDIPEGTGMEVAVRALVASAEADHHTLTNDVHTGILRAAKKAGARESPRISGTRTIGD